MSSVKKELLLKHKVIEGVFDYQDIDPEIADRDRLEFTSSGLVLAIRSKVNVTKKKHRPI